VSTVCDDFSIKDTSSDEWTTPVDDGVSNGDLSIREINKIKSSDRSTLHVFLKRRSSRIQLLSEKNNGL
jgi:hypothetical protein